MEATQDSQQRFDTFLDQAEVQATIQKAAKQARAQLDLNQPAVIDICPGTAAAT